VAERDPGLAFKLEDLGREAERANHAVADLIDQVEHTVQLRDSIKTDRLNTTTYALTILATVLLVPTLVAGIYGMNFRYMPELRWHNGYYLVLALMVVSVTLVWLAIRYALRRADLRFEESEMTQDPTSSDVR
jgi:magnesium transporter